MKTLCHQLCMRLTAWLLFGMMGLLLILSFSTSVFAQSATAQADQPNTLNDDLVVLSQLSQGQQNSSMAASASANQTATAQAPNSTPIKHDNLLLNNPVIDEAGILTASEKASLEQKLRTIHNDNLAQIAIVIVPTTDGVDIFDYALAVANRWQLGDKDRDNGILVLVAINDRELYILTGYGVEGVIPDVVAKRIIRDNITPFFKAGRYAEGLNAGISRIEERLRADPETLAEADKTAEDDESIDNFIGFALAFSLFFGLILTKLFGRLLGTTINSGIVVLIGLTFGVGLAGALALAVVLWFVVLIGSFFGIGVISGGGGWSSGGSSGGGSGGFGGGGYSGGGGGFGGGGAGGSW